MLRLSQTPPATKSFSAQQVKDVLGYNRGQKRTVLWETKKKKNVTCLTVMKNPNVRHNPIVAALGRISAVVDGRESEDMKI